MTSSSPLPGQQLIKLGLLAPITGPNAFYGGQILRGANAAVATANLQGGMGGQKIELVPYDTPCEKPQISALSRLVESARPITIIGAFCPGDFRTVNDYLVAHSIMAISLNAVPAMQSSNRLFFFADLRTPAINAVVRFAVEKHDARNIALFSDRTWRGRLNTDALKGVSSAYGVNVVASYETDSPSGFVSLASDTVRKGADAAIFLSDLSDEVVPVMREYLKAAPNLKLYSWSGPITVESTLRGSNGLTGVVFPLYYQETPKLGQLLKGTNLQPNGTALFAYELVSAWVGSVKGVRTYEASSIAAAFSTTQYEGVSGRVFIVQQGGNRIVKEFSLATWKDDRPVVIQPFFVCHCPCWPWCR